jgi:PKD repeat protein
MKTITKISFAIISFLLLSSSLWSQNVYRWYQDGVIMFQMKTTSAVIPGKGGAVPMANMAFLREFEKYGITEVTHKHPDINDEVLRRTYQIDFTEAELVDDFIAELSRLDFIEYAEKKEHHELLYTPNDPQFNQNNMWGLFRINAPQAWDISFGSSDVIVAVTDDAIHTGHPDLQNMLVQGHDATNGSNDPNPCGSNNGFHGTHVSGTVGAETDNGIGVASIGFGVSVMPVKIGNCNGALTAGYEGVQWAAQNGAHVINMSWGGGGSSNYGSNICTFAYNQGAVLIAAAGNNNQSTQFYPAAYNTVVAVASTTTNDSKSNFSQFGSWIGVSAPGSNILSLNQNNGYSNSQGTSMASPLVAGLAGLIKSHAPSMTNANIIDCLLSTADNIDAANPNFIGQLGAGRINAYEALMCASAYLSELDAGIIDILNAEGQVCSEEVTPTVVLRNFGSNTLTNVTINYQLDNNSAQSFAWSGNLPQGQMEQITLPILTPGAGSFTLTAWTYSPNGGTDENPSNDSSSSEFSIVDGGEESQLTIITDCYGDEITWEIRDDNGNVVVNGGPYTQNANGTTNNYNICLSPGCYTFHIFDTYGDGMYGSQWQNCSINGNYYMVDQDGVMLFEMTAANADFGSSASHDFCTSPTSSLDAGITAIVSPTSTVCGTSVQPEVRLRNFGSDVLTSVTINYQANGGNLQTYNWTGSLASNQVELVTLPAINIGSGNINLVAYTSNPNGGTDENPSNNNAQVNFNAYSVSVPLPFTEDFESNSFATNNWTILNPDNSVTWDIVSIQGTSPGSRAARLNFYDYQEFGQRDAMITPPLNFAGYTSVDLTFEHAYRRYDQSSSDSLIVYVSTDCGATYTRVFARGEDGTGTFATATTTNQAFVPQNSGEWCMGTVGSDCFTINLDAYAGQSQVFVKFESYNAGTTGNNLYIDNINIDGESSDEAPIPNFSASSQSICTGEAITFTDMSTNGPTSWEWTFQGGNPATSQNQNPIVTYDTPGTFEVTLTVANNFGSETLSQTSYITVNQSPDVAVSTSNNIICSGESVNLTASGANSYSWSPSFGLNTTTGASVVATPTSTITYMVTGSNGGCSEDATITITVNPTPNLTVSADETTICPGQQAVITASGADTYSWSPAGSLSSSTGASVTANPSVTTVYTVVGASNAGCESEQQITITVDENATPDVAITPATNEICEGESVIISASGADTYAWSPGGSLNQTSGSQVIATPSTTTTYTVVGLNVCGDGQAQVTITVNSLPDTPVIQQDGNTLFVDAQGNSVQWYKDGVLIPGANAETLEIDEQGFYSVTVTTNAGCEATSSMFEANPVSVQDDELAGLKIYPNPTAHELFVELSEQSGKVQVRVYSAVGQLIHSSQHQSSLISIDAQSWSAGFYFLSIETATKSVTHKIVKQ